jgi:hypothetical protein
MLLGGYVHGMDENGPWVHPTAGPVWVAPEDWDERYEAWLRGEAPTEEQLAEGRAVLERLALRDSA